MSARQPEARYTDLTEGMRFGIEQLLRLTIHTTVPGIVLEYDPTTKRARVQPALRLKVRENGTEENLDRLPILDVPVRQTAVGGHMEHHAIHERDVVLLAFSQRGIENFKARWGELSDWPDGAVFQERDAMAIPWGREDIDPVFTVGWLIQDEQGDYYIHVGPESAEEGAPTRIKIAHDPKAAVTVKADEVLAQWGPETFSLRDGHVRINSTGDVTITATGTIHLNAEHVQHGGVEIDSHHTHPYSWTDPGGSGDTGPPQ